LNNPYRLLGLVLSLSGAVLAPVFYFIVDSVALTGTAISEVILGITCIAIANARPYISPEAARLLLRTGMENTSALIEELGLTSRAVYLPSSMRGGKAQALVPLTEEGSLARARNSLPGRLIVRYGAGTEDMAIAITTPGSVSLELLESRPGPAPGEIESALNYLLHGVLDIAGGCRVDIEDQRVMITINDCRMGYEDIWFYRCLGSPVASIAAAIVAEATGSPVKVAEERTEKQKSLIALEIVPKD